MAIERKVLEPCLKDAQKTYYVRIEDHHGRAQNLTGYTITATAYKPTTPVVTVTPTCTALTQTGPDIGIVSVQFTAANLDTAGEWRMVVKAAPGGGNAEPLTPFSYSFEVVTAGS